MNDDRREYLRKVAALSVKPKRRLIEALIEAERRIRDLDAELDGLYEDAEELAEMDPA